MTATPASKISPTQQYFSTAQTAKLLGLSLGTVQQMVEEGILEAWKTKGGHRRILQSSIDLYLTQRGTLPATSNAEISVLIAEDEVIQQTLYRQCMSAWGLPLHVEIVSNGIDGLLAVGQRMPDVLIADLMLPGVDGFKMVRTLRASPSMSGMDIIVISSLDESEIAAQGGLPADVTIYNKPIPFLELRGYFQAKVSQKRKDCRANGFC